MRGIGNTNQRHFCTQNPLLKRKGNYVAEKRTQTKKKEGKLTQKNKKSHQDMEERHQIYREILKNFTIMSDAFMRNVLKEKACTEYILQVIMEESELTVEDQVIQHDYKNLQGRSTIMDCVATDQKNRQMNIEIQQESKDASPQRSRYNSALLDMNTLNPGQSVKELPESYIRCEMTPTSVGGEQQISISGGSQSPSDIASGRIAEMRRRSMSCIA